MHSDKIIKTIAVVIVVSIIYACAPALYIPNQNNVAIGANLQDLQAGRKLYVNKCGSCHSLVLPEKHTQEQWPALVDKMEMMSKINTEEKKLILNYLMKGAK